MKHIEERVELDLRVWRYLLPPSLETPGHEIMGSQPVWQPIKPTDHFIYRVRQSIIFSKQFFYQRVVINAFSEISKSHY